MVRSVTLVCVAMMVVGYAGAAQHQKSAPACALAPVPPASSPRAVGTVAENDGENSGIVASRARPGLFWSIEDSADCQDGADCATVKERRSRLIACDATGRTLGVLAVAAPNEDWEDLAVGRGVKGEWLLYIADTGDNTGSREHVTVYRLREPAAPGAASRTTIDAPTMPALAAEAIEVTYPGGEHFDALGCFVDGPDLFLATRENPKAGGAEGAGFRLFVLRDAASRKAGSTAVLESFGSRIATDARWNTALDRDDHVVTGADLSPDGRLLALCDFDGVMVMPWPGRKRPDCLVDAWSRARHIALGETQPQREGICFTVDGSKLVATSEGTGEIVGVTLSLGRRR